MTKDHEGRPIWTAAGFVTPVSDQDYVLLQNHHVFKRHLDAGLLKVLNSDISSNHGAVIKEASKMEKTEHLALMTSEKLKKKIKVTTSLSQKGSEFRL
jgi:hypothetical protein